MIIFEVFKKKNVFIDFCNHLKKITLNQMMDEISMLLNVVHNHIVSNKQNNKINY